MELKHNSIQLAAQLNGGLGNQIFQYLAAMHFSEKLKISEVRYELSNYLREGYRACGIRELFGLQDQTFLANHRIADQKRLYAYLTRVTWDIQLALLPIVPFVYFAESRINRGKQTIQGQLDKLYTHVSKKKRASSITIYTEGYWQDPRKLMISSALPHVHLPEVFTNKAQSYITAHIRRGDYIHDPLCYSWYGNAFKSIDYIRTAFDILPYDLRNYPVIICTDDISWCQHCIIPILSSKGINACISMLSELDDWRIMANARLNIISNSSYSFTAAFLNHGNKSQQLRVIMPEAYTSRESVHNMGWASIKGALAI
jgi:hypothetical protein